MRVSNCRFVCFAMALALAASACGGDKPKPPTAPPFAQSVKITSDTASVLVGDTARLSAQVIMSDGTTGGGTISWSSSNPAVMTIDAQGVAVGISVGNAVLTASSNALSSSVTRAVHLIKAADGLRVAGSGITVLSDSQQIAAGNMTVTRPANAPPLKPGDVVAGADRGSYLQKVITATGTGTTQTLTTQPATLEEALVDAEATILDNFDAPAAMRAAYLRSKREGGWPVGLTVSPDGLMHFADAPINFNNTTTIGGKSVKLKLNGTLGMRFGAAARAGTEAFEFKLKIKGGRFKRLRVASTMGVAFNATSTVEFSGGVAGASFTVPWPSIVLTKGPGGLQCVTVGILPVCYSVSIVFLPYVEAGAAVQVEVSQQASMNYGVTAGVDYNDGNFQVIRDSFGQTIAQPVKLNLGGSVGMKIGIRPALEVLLYGAAGPFIGLNEYIQMTAGISNNGYRWFTETEVGLDLEVGLRARVFGIRIAEFTNATQLLKLPLGAAEGTAATATPSPANVALQVGGQQNLSATVKSDLGGIPLFAGGWSCGSSNPAVATVNVTGCTVTAVAPGNATITMTSGTYNAVKTTVPVVVAPSGPLVTLNRTSLSALHSIGSNPCPHNLGSIILTNRSAGAVNWTATSSSAALRLTPAAANNVAPNATSQLQVEYTCSPQAAVNGVITITARSTNGAFVENHTVSVTISMAQALISLDKSAVSVTHIYGVSPCPQLVGTVNVTSGPLTGGYSAIPDFPGRGNAIRTSPPFVPMTMPGVTTPVGIYFHCDAKASVTGPVRFNANNTGSSRMESYGVTVTVTVIDPPPIK